MLQRIEFLKQIKGLTEVILGNDESRQTYKIMYIDDATIKLLRKGDYSRLRILHIDSLLNGEWYFESDSCGISQIKPNTDSQLLNSLNKKKKPEEE